MNKPNIKQWQNRPPFGGWAIVYVLNGQDFRCESSSPFKVVACIKEIQQINGVYEGEAPIWDYCNDIWTSRDPKRAIVKTKVVQASLLEMGKNLISEAKKVVKAAVGGKRIKADKEEIERRMAICLPCEHFLKRSNRCAKCGCYLDYKTRLKTSSCPIGKW